MRNSLSKEQAKDMKRNFKIFNNHTNTAINISESNEERDYLCFKLLDTYINRVNEILTNK